MPHSSYQQFLKRLGSTIREHRKRLGKGQVALSAEVEVYQSSISRLERGAQGFDSLTLYRICSRLGISPSALLAEAEGVQPHGLPADAVEVARFWLSLPPADREQYRSRLQALSLAYAKSPIPDDDPRLAALRAPKSKPRASKK